MPQGALWDVHEKGILAVDGKVSRGSGRKEAADGPVKAMQMLNVYSCDTGEYFALRKPSAHF